MFARDPSWPSFLLAIAGLPVRLFCSHPTLFTKLAARYLPFLVTAPEQQPVSTLWIQASSGEAAAGFLHARLEFSSGSISWHAPAYSGCIDLKEREGYLDLQSNRPVEDIDYFLRLLYALLAEERGGLLFHAAGIVRSGRAYLFFGPSGSGKTTVARLSPGDLVLNDDLVILLPSGASWAAHGTPFWNPSQVSPQPAEAPLAGLYRLVQDRSVYLEPLSPGLALAEVIASVPVLPQDPARNPALISRCGELLAAAPAYHLHFLPDSTFWVVIMASMG